MTTKSEALLDELADMLYEKKAVLLKGNSGTGKTYMARKLAERLGAAEYNLFGGSAPGDVKTEIIACHGSMTYEDIVSGITVSAAQGHMTFEYKDRLLLETLKAAAEDYEKRQEVRHVLIFDDIQRSGFSSLLGDAIGAVGAEGRPARLLLNDGTAVSIAPDFYVIATYNPSETGAASSDSTLLAKFYTKEILSDIAYMTEDPECESAVWYDQVRALVLRYLDMQYRTDFYEQNRYLPGHGCFSDRALGYQMRYQVIPGLKQYVAEGILDRAATDAIEALEKACYDQIRIQKKRHRQRRLSGYRQGVDATRFEAEDATSVPLENLVGRIAEQELLADEEIENAILFNSNVCYREKSVSGVAYRAALVAGDREYVKLCRNSGDRRKFYNAGTIKIQGKTFHFTGGMQPKEYTLKNIWDSLSPYRVGETTSPNVILFGIVRHYYKTLMANLEAYTSENPEDTQKTLFYGYVKKEWEAFLEDYKEIRPEEVAATGDRKADAGRKAAANKKANQDVRERIGRLTVLWKNPGEMLTLPDGTEITIERVERVMEEDIYKEYKEAMDILGIKQMILQGPPGTSKTYTAKAFLKYMAHHCSDSALADLQISDYESADRFCARMAQTGEKPEIAWDIVQFHPSYGYEDFIRGIRVSTKQDSDTVIYETVNKVLAGMAALAVKNPETEFFLIIDEINRANLATVFGELIYGLEYRDEAVATPYAVNDDYRISLPENLYVIGTMNTADKSIGSIDYAIRRRFLFFEQLPDEKVIENYKKDAGEAQLELNRQAVRLFNHVKTLFGEDYLSPEYRKEDVQIGHTYFLADTKEKLRRRFEYQIIPILKEYYKDGIISYEPKEDVSGFDGLLNCIAGKISMTSEKTVTDQIFEALTV